MPEESIPLSVPNLCGNELKYVTQAVESEWVSTAGPFVTDFEQAVARYVGVGGAVSCQSGTSGLHISLLEVGVTSDDAVIVPTLTFIAAVNPVRYIGAVPLFMDCDDSLCIDPVKVRRFCEQECDFNNGVLTHRTSGRRVSAMVIVHVFGNMADMESLMDIANEFNIKVVEDATEALGTRYEEGVFAGRFAGTIGDMGVYSFNGNKIITTGGGGMIASNDPDKLRHAKHLTTQAKADPLYYIHDEIGYNYRLTNLQAALGLAQMESLEKFIEKKTTNYNLYEKLLVNEDGVELLPVRKGIRSNHWFYAIACDGKRHDRSKLIAGLGRNGIQARPIWGLIHEQEPYNDELAYDITEACRYHDCVVNIPCSTNLTHEQVKAVVNAISQEAIS